MYERVGTVTSVGYLEEIESRRGSKGGYSSGTLASMLATPIVFRSAKGDNGLLPAKRFIAIVSESHPHPSYSSFHGTFLVAVRSDESILKFSRSAAQRQFATSRRTLTKPPKPAKRGFAANRASLFLRHRAHPHFAIMMGRCDPQAVGVQVHVAGGVGQCQVEQFVGLIGLPEPEMTARIASGGRDQEPGGMKSQPRDQALPFHLDHGVRGDIPIHLRFLYDVPLPTLRNCQGVFGQTLTGVSVGNHGVPSELRTSGGRRLSTLEATLYT